MAINLGNLVSNTPPPYRFKLTNPETAEYIVLRNEPINWNEAEIEMNRLMDAGGVFTNFVVDSLTFIKEGANFIRNIFNEKEINGQCNLTVGVWKKSTRTYWDVPVVFALNFATIKPQVKIGKYAIGVNVKTINTSELVKFQNRKKTKVDLTKFVSMNGTEVIGYADLKDDLNFPALDERVYAGWIDDSTERLEIENNGSTIYYTNLQMSIFSTEFSEAQAVSHATSITSLGSVANFFENAGGNYTVDFTYYVWVYVRDRKGGFLNPQDVYHIVFEEIDSGGTIQQTFGLGDFGSHKEDFIFNGTQQISVSAGNSLRVYIKTDATDNVAAHIVTSNFSLTYDVAGTDARTVQSLPIYDAFNALLQRILDLPYPFYSDKFGLTDKAYNSDGDKYLTEDQTSLANLVTGLNLRGAALFDDNNPFAISFDDLFQCAKSLWNVGYELEYRDGNYRIRIEDYADFFEDVEALDLSDRINPYDIEKEVMPELAYSSIKTGYEKYEYESVNGRGEYNTNNERTTVINTDSVFDNVSKVRADTKGIIDLLEMDNDTVDSEADNHIFIVKTQRDGYDWQPEFDTNIAIENESSLFGESSMNLYFTPTRNLLRHGNRLKGYLQKYLSSYLRFQSADKLQTLETTGEGYTVKENDDILVDELDDAIYKPFAYRVTCPFHFDDMITLLENPKGYINFGSVRGYLLNLKKVNSENKAEITIIEKC